MGKGKWKAQDTKAAQKPNDPDTGLVTDTDYHTGGLHTRTFKQIYEFYKADEEPKKEEEDET